MALTTPKLQKHQPATSARAQGSSVQLLVQPFPQLTGDSTVLVCLIPGKKSSRRVRECGNAEGELKGAEGKGRERETLRAKRKAE